MVQHRAILTMATNRKSCMVYRTTSFSMILNDAEPRFQGFHLTMNISETVCDRDIVTMKY